MVSDTLYAARLPAGFAKAHPAINNEGGSEEIWSRILQEVSSKNNSANQGSVIFLGDNQSGKSSLILRMTNGERQNYSSVLEYNYLTVHADPSGSYAYQLGSGTGLGPSDSVNLPLWTLDGKEELAPLLKFALPPQLAKCAFVLCASLEHPGNILPSLQKWYRLVSEQIRAFYPREDIEQAKQMQVRFWQEYVEPIESSMHVENSARLEIDPILLPLEPGVLEQNCGAAIIVVITKSDTHMEVNAEQLDKVQFHVRNFCLERGAALIYTSAKEEKNTQLLYKYLAHRVFTLPFTTPAYIVEKDSIFVPTGWDSEQKLGILKETLSDTELPTVQDEFFLGAGHEPSVEIEDEQTFLQRLTVSINNADSTSSASPKREPTSARVNINSQTGDGNALASFFSSLLKKDTGGAVSAPNSSAGAAGAAATPAAVGPAAVAATRPSVVDAEAHLQNMLGRPQASSTPRRSNNNNNGASNNNGVPEAKLVDTETSLQQDVADGALSDVSCASSALTPRDANNDEEEKQ